MRKSSARPRQFLNCRGTEKFTILSTSEGMEREIFANGKIREKQNSLGGTEWYSYDPLGRLVSVSSLEHGEQCWTYDDFGRIVSEIDETGAQTHFGYDELGRLSSLEREGQSPVFYRYDAFGNMTYQYGGVVPVAYYYDSENRLVSSEKGVLQKKRLEPATFTN